VSRPKLLFDCDPAATEGVHCVVEIVFVEAGAIKHYVASADLKQSMTIP
jgi:hypothetical protein